LQHTNVINDIVESLISDVDWYFHGMSSLDLSDVDDFFRDSSLEPPKHGGVRLRRTGSGASKGGSPASPAAGRVPVPKPRQSRPRGPPPPPAPRPTERHSLLQLSTAPTTLANDSTNL
jgi:hypothetical protein